MGTTLKTLTLNSSANDGELLVARTALKNINRTRMYFRHQHVHIKVLRVYDHWHDILSALKNQRTNGHIKAHLTMARSSHNNEKQGALL